jgi:hypothetical protein
MMKISIDIIRILLLNSSDAMCQVGREEWKINSFPAIRVVVGIFY